MLSGMTEQANPKAEKPLDELTKDELYELATALQVAGRAKMTRQELLVAVKLAQTVAEKAAAEAAEAAAGPQGAGPQGPATEGPVRELTVEEAQKIFAASTASLELVLDDQNLDATLRQAVERELKTRQDREAAEKQLVSRTSEIERWKVVKGGRYVGRDGFITTLPVGSMCTPLTHDLAHVRSQGIELQRLSELEIKLDQMGNQISVLK
jgi:hypothetical protein